jgi:hypothetical protein
MPVPQTFALQPAFLGFCPVTEAVERLAAEGGIEERGAIYTRREVVDFMLDIVGYTSDQPLASYRFLEPSFGGGDFLLPALERLLVAAQRIPTNERIAALEPAIRGVELHRSTYIETCAAVREMLTAGGIRPADADRLLDVWLAQSDFLLCGFDHRFTHVVGNPPYVRQEEIPEALIQEYRRRFVTIYDRADIYVPFIEQSLRLLEPGGKLNFICADRWMKNKYGKKLRALVSQNFSLTVYIDMYGTDAFHSEVSAYPAITMIERRDTPNTRVYARPAINADALGKLSADIAQRDLPRRSAVREIQHVASGSEPWVLDSFEELALVRRLEEQFRALEDAGCKVGIGVATGADKAFIGDFATLDVEESRKLPLVMTRDILDGHVQWRGRGVINPFGDDGKLVPLDAFPRLRRYLEARKDQIAGRHVAEKNPNGWYRTIDRIYPELARREKLLIPDIKGDASIVYEGGRLYPHHNLYFITSDAWDVRALQAVMRSGIARLFVALYCTRMRGGYLRFQAQYLRKIRVPQWRDVSPALRDKLAEFSGTEDRHLLNEIICELYGLNSAELKLIERKTM